MSEQKTLTDALKEASTLLLDGDEGYKLQRVAELLQQSEQINQLKAERQEMVEALDVAMTLLAGNTEQDILMAYNHLYDIRYKNNL